MTAAVLGLGGNLGDPRRQMATAVDRLDARDGISVVAVSGLYRTPPWGKSDQPDFLNAAVRVETRLSPRSLLEAVLGVEAELGRTREERWGPRTIDIDILVYGTTEVDEPGLRIPHPRLCERAFALAPLVEVMPEAEFNGRAAGDWLAAADRSGIVRVAGPEWRERG